MKWLIASDIHGSAECCGKLIDSYKKEKADRLLLHGDLLYHGPRNGLPDNYGPKSVIEQLNALKDEILCVRGNCDADVDGVVLQFPIKADYAYICENGLEIFATHGHFFGCDNPPPLVRGEILLCGHTHVSALEEKDGFIYMNPGSVSLPKGGTPAGYMTLENGIFRWKTLSGETYREYRGALHKEE